MATGHPELLLRLTDLSDLRHLSDLRRCVRAELADAPPTDRDDVVLLVSELVARAIRSSHRCAAVRVLRDHRTVRVEVHHPGADVVAAGPDHALVGSIATSVQVDRAPDGTTLRCEVELPGPRRRPLPVAAGSPLPVPGGGGAGGPLAPRLARALQDGPAALASLAGAPPSDEHDLLVCLARLHALHTAPLDVSGPAVRWQHHPAVAELTWGLEGRVLAGLEPGLEVDPADPAAALVDGPLEPVEDAVAAMRAVAARDLVPDVYRWLAAEATPDELVGFLALEGGPDAGFDDLVAACQVGLAGEPKLELARNYWDEMGRGEGAAVHTVLHDRLVAALDMPRVPLHEQPSSGLLRSVLGSLLVRNRWLQPELVGALGLLELQAGPRCRHVVRALGRCGAPADAFPFYTEHAEVDPHHGKAWLDRAVRPLSADPVWAARMVRGARWRSQVNHRFFAEMHRRFAGTGLPAAV